MRQLIVEERARFSFKTMDILKSLFCLTYFTPRPYLRKTVWGRTVMNYKMGVEKIDKDMDVANIITKIRTLNQFMKMILDVDQRKLLKLRSSKLIDSDEDPKYSIFSAKKCHDKDKMLNILVDNLRQKQLDKRDIKLLRICGLQELIGILKARDIFRVNLRTKTAREQEAFTDGINFDDLQEILASYSSPRLDVSRANSHVQLVAPEDNSIITTNLNDQSRLLNESISSSMHQQLQQNYANVHAYQDNAYRTGLEIPRHNSG